MIIKYPNNIHPYGRLYQPDVLIQRQYFKEMCSLIGITVMYAPPGKYSEYNDWGEINENHGFWKPVGCIFEDYPSQQTIKKLGWVHELQENASIIHLPYDTPMLQKGALVVVPSGIDGANGRLFRITKLSNIMIFPASVTCEIVPEWLDSVSQSQVTNFTETNYNFLEDVDKEEDDDQGIN